MAHPFFWVFVVLFSLHQLWEAALTLLNRREMEKNRGQTPEFFRDKIDPERYQKSIDYNLEKSRFGLSMRVYDIGIVIAIIASGILGDLDIWMSPWGLPGILHSVVYCGLVALGVMILKLPVSLYSHFVIEEKYGFNKMTARTFVVDLLKSLALGSVLGGAVLALVFWLYAQAGDFWWLWAFGAVYGFEFLMAAVYPTLLAPIFNKFVPLPDGSLKDAITALARKIDFKMSGVFTIDGSKRSAHSNAYFAGMGRMRRIVLFDTLQKQLSEREIIAVLGHEMGHNKLKHIQKQLALGLFVSFASFWVLSLLMTWPPFFETFGAGAPAPHKALVIFALFSGHFTFAMTAVTNALSRRYEYASDRFSVEVVKDPEAMISSLVALSRENLSNLTPHPWFSAYHYTHPTTLERVAAIQRQAS